MRDLFYTNFVLHKFLSIKAFYIQSFDVRNLNHSFMYSFILSLSFWMLLETMMGVVVGMEWKEVRETNVCLKHNSNLLIYKNIFIYLYH